MKLYMAPLLATFSDLETFPSHISRGNTWCVVYNMCTHESKSARG